MNITINAGTLANELRLLTKIVPSKPALPILTHVLLSTHMDRVLLRATDLEVSMSGDCLARVDAPGSTVLPLAKFLALVERFTDGDMTLIADKTGVLVRCGAFKSRLQTLSWEDFPVDPDVDGDTITLESELLAKFIARTNYAISATAGKYVVQGALLELRQGIAAMVATDGKRLALVTAPHANAEQNSRVIIPKKTLDVLASQITTGAIEITLGHQHIFFMLNGRLLISRMMSQEFPAYSRIIPREANDKIVSVDKVALANALQRMILIAEDSKSIYFDISAGHLQLRGASATVGSADESMPIKYDDVPLKICVNGEHVLDFLNAAADATITMALKDENSAMRLNDGADHLAVIMLIRGR